ncbi:MAG: UDP-N-acetylmuramoylalanine--D-glutamate ligase (EC [uncultured Thiotrichaceae bacterium]|uniref:UDP-N-acetylmuramoylalanine--D-glutamate ligase n=1 Tax=uncultured Thiotrichaceae bacterium TaxID=298394 RepID=A0A6S6SX28_9GAMM|nr:MAG: UDP-N-acetylmuramoylalanine--D-glutamate ligase (EC [uncultured Thiotrichaceae bacterium]
MTVHAHNLEMLIVGLGPTGLSVARHLGRQGVAFAVTDSRTNPPGMEALQREFPEAPCDFGGFNETFFAPAKCLVVSPGVAVSTPVIKAAHERGVEIMGDVELFVRAAQAPIIAITGSNGKSSVTKLVELMAHKAGMSCYAIGNIGRFVMDVLTDPVPDLYVMELSSFQLETTQSLHAVSATVLNVCEDHLDRYDSFAAYAAVKAIIFQNCANPVLNREDVVVMQMADSDGFSGMVTTFGADVPAEGQFGILEQAGRRYFAKGSRCLMAIDEMRLPGEHNAVNALAALALGEPAGIPEAAMLAAIREFNGLPYRTEWVRERAGVNWFNDSKGTNVGATVAALQGLPGKTVLIAGGMGKGADFSPLTSVVADHARAVVLMGEDAGLMAEVMPENMLVVKAGSMQEAVSLSADLAQAGDNVLLSPACASFDMFANYMQRGDVFAEAVRELSV